MNISAIYVAIRKITFPFIIAVLFCSCADDLKEIERETLEEYQARCAIGMQDGLFTDPRDCKKYKVTTIGEQIWMAENLNYAATGSKCLAFTGSDFDYVDSNAVHCDISGRLYDWNIALNACPSGWHLPSYDEWQTLEAYVDSNANALRAKTGWTNCDTSCKDTYNFSALPSYSIYQVAGWWTADEDEYNNDSAYVFSLQPYNHNLYSTNTIHYGDIVKTMLYSVRCIYGYSSSSSSSSSSSEGISYGTLNYDGKAYKTVEIGEQTWMAENLNRWTSYGSVCYADDSKNCDKYGRLYNYEIAMTICPDGWHLPSMEDFAQLLTYIDSDYDNSERSSRTAGKHLKTKTGWSDCAPSRRPNECSDTYGFSALPGGGLYGYFNDVGNWGCWWSADSTYDYNYNAYRLCISSGSDTYLSDNSKTNFFSVRCLKGYSSSSEEVSSSSSSCGGSDGPQDDLPYEDYDYKTVQIGCQIWMAENLKYEVEGSKCYGQDGLIYSYDFETNDSLTVAEVEANCKTYGRLYNWVTAMNLGEECYENYCSGDIGFQHQGICPSGWHIPSREDWDKLYRYADGTSETSSPYNSLTAGLLLKANTGWNSSGSWDPYGFSALPGGRYSDGKFHMIGYGGYWWSANEDDNTYAYRRSIYDNLDLADEYSTDKTSLYSIRCIKNQGE